MGNLHAGHRERMRRRFLKSGGEDLPDHNLLEMLLFYAIPRRDTNELAHELINKAGSLQKLITMPKEDMKQKLGISEHLAEYLSFLGKVCTAPSQQLRAKRSLQVRNGTADYVAKRLKIAQNLGVMVMLLDEDSECKACAELKKRKGKFDKAVIDALVDTARGIGASDAVLLQHESVAEEVRRMDFAAVEKALKQVGISVVECIVAKEDEYTMIKRHEDGINL